MREMEAEITRQKKLRDELKILRRGASITNSAIGLCATAGVCA